MPLQGKLSNRSTGSRNVDQEQLGKHCLYWRLSLVSGIQAARWLGIPDPVKLLDEDSAAEAFQPRPEGLGLGAKFLPHQKV